ncbi:MAG: GntR family transcriptional regulator [Syntrophobacteraceae bacterium]
MRTREQTSVIDVSNINEKVYNFIKNNIVTYNYPPGYTLHLAQLSEMLGVSHTPIKDALFRLAGEGLVEIAPRKGTFVKDITEEDIHEILQTRIILESAVVEAIAPLLTDSQIQELEQAHAEMVSIDVRDSDIESYKAYMECDSHFHLLLFRIFGNRRLINLYRNLNAHIQIVRFRLLQKRGKSPSTDREHELVLQALRERNAFKAKEAIRHHLLTLDSSIVLP